MPIEFSMPAAVSATRGTGLPMRRFGVSLLVTTAPRRARSMAAAYSCAKQPEAGMTGFFRMSDPTLTFMSAKLHLPGDRTEREHRTLAAYPPEDLAAVLVEKAHAREAHAHGAGHLLLERNLTSGAELLQQGKQPVRAAGVHHIGRLLVQQCGQEPLDRLHRRAAVGVEHRMHL